MNATITKASSKKMRASVSDTDEDDGADDSVLHHQMKMMVQMRVSFTI